MGFGLVCPRGDGPHKAVVKCRGNPAGTLQAALNPAISKTGVKMTLDERQSVFTLIRTDTTHDLYTKYLLLLCSRVYNIPGRVQH